MKSVLFFATSALAATASIQKRQASAVSAAVGGVSESVAALNSAVTGFTGINQVASLQGAAAAVLSEIESANSAISALAVLSQSDAITLAQPISDLADLVESSVQNVISKRSTFDSTGVSSVVLSTLTDLRAASGTLSETILSKIPSSLQDIGQGLAARITTALDNGVQSYSDAGEATPSSSAAATSGAASTSAPAATTSGAAASTTGAGYATSAAPATTSHAATSGAATTSRPAATSSIAVYPGAAGHNAVQGYGAAAMAALAVAALL